LAVAGERLGEEITPRTVRLYATQGLIDRPGREGRSAVYGRRHLLQLLLIRSLARRGLSLAAIGPLIGLDDQAMEGQLSQLEGDSPQVADSLSAVASSATAVAAGALSAPEPGTAEPGSGAGGSPKAASSERNQALDYLRSLQPPTAGDSQSPSSQPFSSSALSSEADSAERSASLSTAVCLIFSQMLHASLCQRGPSLATSALGAALATTVTLLLPQPASALNFTFNFGDGVSGITEGLNDNQTNQTSAIVKILSISPNDSYATGGGAREYYYWSTLNVNNLGFDVQNGSITATNWTWAGRSVPQNVYSSGYPNEAYGGSSGPNNGYSYDLELKNLSGIICYSNKACFQQGPI
jgi:DNA-binding transcriptional MerR regulator